MEYEKSSAGQGISLAGLIIGIIALFISFMPCIGFAALFPGVIAIILSVVGLSQASRANGKMGMPIAATVISGLSILIVLAWLVLFANVIGDKDNIREVIEHVMDEEVQEELQRALEEVHDELEDAEINVTIEHSDSEERAKETKGLEEKLKSLEDSTSEDE